MRTSEDSTNINNNINKVLQHVALLFVQCQFLCEM